MIGSVVSSHYFSYLVIQECHKFFGLPFVNVQQVVPLFTLKAFHEESNDVSEKKNMGF